MEVDSVIAVLRRGAKKLAPVLFEKKYDYSENHRFLALYVEGEYCCYLIAQAKSNPVRIDILGAYKDILLLEKIKLETDQYINNKELINIDNLYYLEAFNIGSVFYFTKDTIVHLLEKLNSIEFVNRKTNESLFVYKRNESADYIDVRITKTEFDTLMLDLTFNVLIDLQDECVWLKNVSYGMLIDILYVRKNDVIIANGV